MIGFLLYYYILFCYSLFLSFLKPSSFLIRERKGVDLDERGYGEELGRVIWYSVRKEYMFNNSIKRTKKQKRKNPICVFCYYLDSQIPNIWCPIKPVPSVHFHDPFLNEISCFCSLETLHYFKAWFTGWVLLQMYQKTLLEGHKVINKQTKQQH